MRQEEISWGAGRWLTDCISLIVRPGSRWDGEPRAGGTPGSRAKPGRWSARLVRYL